MLKRRLVGEIASRLAFCIASGNDECDARSRLYIVGTTVKNVIGLFLVLDPIKGAAKRSQTALALNGNMNSIVEPANKGVRSALIVPWMW